MAPHQVSERVEARVRARMGLYKQGAISLLLILGLAVINWATYRHRWWFWWPALGLAILWGIRAVAVYNQPLGVPGAARAPGGVGPRGAHPPDRRRLGPCRRLDSGGARI
jgi:hypothetical protein